MSDQQKKSSSLILPIKVLLVNLHSALKFDRLYPGQHPLVVKAVSKLKDSINEFFATNKSLRLYIKRQQIFFQGQLINAKDEILDNLALTLYRLGIRELNFYQGLTDEELLKFIGIVNSDPDRVAAQGSVEVFQEKGFNFIKVNETLRSEIFQLVNFDAAAGQREKLLQPQQLNEIIALADFVRGQEKKLSAEGNNFFVNMLSRPGEFAAVIQALARTELKEQTGAPAENTISLPDYLNSAFAKFVEQIEQQPQEMRQSLYQHLASSILTTEEEGKVNLFNKFISRLREGTAESKFVAALSENELTPLLQRRKDAGASAGEISTLITSLPVEYKIKKEIFGRLNIEDRLANLTKPVVEEKKEQISLSPLEKTEIQYQLPPDLNNVVAELSSYTEAELKDIEKLSLVLEKENLEESHLNVLLELTTLETREEKYEKVLDLLEKRVSNHLNSGNFTWAARYQGAIGRQLADSGKYPLAQKYAREVIIRLGAKEIVQKLIDSLKSLNKDEASFKEISNYLALLPGESVPYLLDILAEEEQMSMRRLLCEIVVRVGKLNMACLRQRLADPNWFLVRNIVWILAMIKDPESIQYLTPLLQHENVGVRLEAITALGELGGAGIFEWLIVGLNDKNSRVRQLSVEWLGNLGDKRAVEILTKIVKKTDPLGLTIDLKKEAIAALGATRVAEVIPFLTKLAKKKWWSFLGPPKELAAAAQNALQKNKGMKKNG